jgi:nucleolar MIF4G domain-containing protein 1
MLETMMALKNNDMRKIPGYDPEPLEKTKKLLRTLVGSPYMDLSRQKEALW